MQSCSASNAREAASSQACSPGASCSPHQCRRRVARSTGPAHTLGRQRRALVGRLVDLARGGHEQRDDLVERGPGSGAGAVSHHLRERGHAIRPGTPQVAVDERDADGNGRRRPHPQVGKQTRQQVVARAAPEQREERDVEVVQQLAVAVHGIRHRSRGEVGGLAREVAALVCRDRHERLAPERAEHARVVGVVGRAQRRDAHAAALAADDEALVAETTQRLAHRGGADPELAGDVALDEAHARAQLAAHDVGAQPVGRRVDDALEGQRPQAGDRRARRRAMPRAHPPRARRGAPRGPRLPRRRARASAVRIGIALMPRRSARRRSVSRSPGWNSPAAIAARIASRASSLRFCGRIGVRGAEATAAESTTIAGCPAGRELRVRGSRVHSRCPPSPRHPTGGTPRRPPPGRHAPDGPARPGASPTRSPRPPRRAPARRR